MNAWELEQCWAPTVWSWSPTLLSVSLSTSVSTLYRPLMQFASLQPHNQERKGGCVRERTSLSNLWFSDLSSPLVGLDWVLESSPWLKHCPRAGGRELRWEPLSRSVMPVARGGASVIRGKGTRCWEGKVGKRSLWRIFQLTGMCLWVQENMDNRNIPVWATSAEWHTHICANPTVVNTLLILITRVRGKNSQHSMNHCFPYFGLYLFPLCILSPKALNVLKLFLKTKVKINLFISKAFGSLWIQRIVFWFISSVWASSALLVEFESNLWDQL